MTTKINTREYRIIGATPDEQEFWRRRGVCLDNPHSLPPVAVHRADVAAYRADRYIAYDLSVSEYMRRAEVPTRTEGRRVTAAEWLSEHLGEQARLEEDARLLAQEREEDARYWDQYWSKCNPHPIEE